MSASGGAAPAPRTDRASEDSTRSTVLDAARRLFGERGYSAVTIREIAAEAGVSAAMVMKVGGSKEQLHSDAAPLEPSPLGAEVPLAGMGELLVRRMLDRRDTSSSEPWVRALYLVQDAPDPDAARREFRDRFLQRFRLGGPEDERRADIVACLMVGLAAGTRTLRLLPPDSTDLESVVTEYGALVQSVLDGLDEQSDPAPLG